MKIKPLNDNVILRLDSLRERKTEAGLFIPDTAKPTIGDQSVIAEVLACGPGTRGFPMEVSVGDRVIVHSLCGEKVVGGVDAQSVRLGIESGEELRIVRCSEILGVLE